LAAWPRLRRNLRHAGTAVCVDLTEVARLSLEPGGGQTMILDLDLLDTHRFANGAVYLRYRSKPA
jgi:hypothetical protein